MHTWLSLVGPAHCKRPALGVSSSQCSLLRDALVSLQCVRLTSRVHFTFLKEEVPKRHQPT